MKTISEMAKCVGVTYRNVNDCILENNLTPVAYDGKDRFYSKLQEDFIYKQLYFAGLTNMITFESKMNFLKNQI